VPDRDAAVAALGEVIVLGGREAALDARLGRARALMALERAGEAVADFVEAVAICAEDGIEEGGALIRSELAVAYREADRPAEAAEVAEEAVAALDALGLGDEADAARHLLAGIYRELDDGPAALALYDELAARLAPDSPQVGRGDVHEHAAEVLYRADRDAEAAQRFGLAAEDFRSAGRWSDELRALRLRVAALHWADDVPALQEAIRSAFARHEAVGGDEPELVWERGVLGFEAGRALMSRGRYAEALPYLQGAPARLRAIGADDDADRIEGMAGEALLRSGRAAEAAEVLAGTLARSGPQSPNRAIAARVLAEALDELGREADASAVREQYGLDSAQN
jgi:tetratricopeptide (TPR) repeat protein